jgi:acetyltransferase-like isoleucine patch superfamily enzyme
MIATSSVTMLTILSPDRVRPRDSVAQVSARLRFRRFLGSRIRAWRRYVNEIATVGPDDDYATTFFYFGRGAALMAPMGVIYNERYLSIGDETLIGPNVCLTAGINGDQPMLATPTVSIGRKCIIGRGSHIIGHWSIELGDEIQTGPYVYITDQNHSYEALDEPVGWQRPSEAAVKIGSGSWLGANVVILPGTTLGKNTTVAAGAVVRGEFPDHVVLGGVPAKVLRHYDADDGWVTGPL